MFTSSGLLRVCKFGGTSLCNAEAFRSCGDIIRSDDWRRYIVLSAPGKRTKTDTKITDMLYSAYDDAAKCEKLLSEILLRYKSITDELGILPDFDIIFNEQISIALSHGRDHLASRGEYFSALIMSAFLSYEFVDAADVVFFDENGLLDAKKTDIEARKRLSGVERAIIPGFFGSMPDGSIKTFSRGGSDITGSLVAKAVKADVYENFTDVDGLMRADPSIVDDPGIIDILSYGELREMSYMGASVLHRDAVFPVSKSGIPINIKNTFAPDKAGTIIVDKSEKSDGMIGVSGKKGFCLINIRFMGECPRQLIFTEVLSVFIENKIFIEHMVSGVDSLTVVVKQEDISDKKKTVISEICTRADTKWVEIKDGYSIIAAIGKNASKAFFRSQLSLALAKSGINSAVCLHNNAESIVFFCVESKLFEKSISTVAGIL